MCTRQQGVCLSICPIVEELGLFTGFKFLPCKSLDINTNTNLFPCTLLLETVLRNFHLISIIAFGYEANRSTRGQNP